jgi:UDP-glucuronate 4-epimerase
MTDPADWAARLDPATPVLVTGAAGFIGYHVARRLLDAGIPVIGVDNLNAYYDVTLKQDRLDVLRGRQGFAFAQVDITDRAALSAVFDVHAPRHVVHLAAQAGVRHSITHPHDYAQANLIGFLNILEDCRRTRVAHLAYASSSSVYGGNTRLPFSVGDSVDHPVSLYAATKKANELMAHSYSHLYGVPATGLRFFTVYGPWGRPDMAMFIFTKALYEGAPITLNNHGDMGRDFTYIDDIVEGVVRLIPQPPVPDPAFDTDNPDPATSWAPHRVFNIGNHRRERLGDLVALLEELTGRTAIINSAPMQPGDVKETWADVTALQNAVGFSPDTPLRVGLERFVDWYRHRYRVN